MKLFENFEIVLVDKVKGWIEKGDGEENSFDKLISYWIAFNIIYNVYSKKKHPKRDYTQKDRCKAVQIKELLENGLNFSSSMTFFANNLIHELSNFRVEKWKRKFEKIIIGMLRF